MINFDVELARQFSVDRLDDWGMALNCCWMAAATRVFWLRLSMASRRILMQPSS